MRRLLAALILLLIGCGSSNSTEDGGTTCVTPCGVTYYGLQGVWTCAQVRAVELVTLSAFTKYVPKYQPGFWDTCGSLRGWSLAIQPTASWVSPAHVTEANPKGIISGVTYCDGRWMYAGNGPPHESAIPHEMAHAIQRCVPVFHENWSDAGIWEALNAVRGGK